MREGGAQYRVRAWDTVRACTISKLKGRGEMIIGTEMEFDTRGSRRVGQGGVHFGFDGFHMSVLSNC
jgi:hypothetical protein